MLSPPRPRLGAPAPRPGDREAKVSLLMLVGILFALPVGFVLGYALGFDPGDPKGVGPTLEGFEWVRLVLLALVVTFPFIVGTLFGLRAVRRGSRLGRWGLGANAVVGLALLALVTASSIVDSITFKPDVVTAVSVTAGAPVSGVTYVGVRSSTPYGAILVAAGDVTLYSNEFEAQAWRHEFVDCKDSDCKKVWAPFVATNEVRIAAGVDASKVGAVKRSDGIVQVTYAGHGLFTYKKDKPGQYAPFGVMSSKEAGGGPLYGDWHVVTTAGTLMPAPVTYQ